MHQEIIENIKPELDKAINFLEGELAKIRTGRASISFVEDIEVEYLDQKFALKQLASISVPKPREIVMQPWDKSYIESIEKAISRSSLGVNAIVDGETIRISLPPLSREYRENLLRVISQKKEEARKTVRRWRGEAWEEVQELTKEGKIREDDKYRAKDELQDLVDSYNEKIEKLIKKKEKEIME